jgi:hypothetical protein
LIGNVLCDLFKLTHYTNEAFHAVAVFVHRGRKRADRCGLLVARVGRGGLQAGDRAAQRLLTFIPSSYCGGLSSPESQPLTLDAIGSLEITSV